MVPADCSLVIIIADAHPTVMRIPTTEDTDTLITTEDMRTPATTTEDMRIPATTVDMHTLTTTEDMRTPIIVDIDVPTFGGIIGQVIDTDSFDSPPSSM